MWRANKDGNRLPVLKTAKTRGAVDTLVGRQTELTGDIRFAGGLYVEGKIKGQVLADSDTDAVLNVSESGMVEGDVRVPHVVLNGTVKGNVHASGRITLSAKARVHGNVYYKLIEMTNGAVVNGRMVYRDRERMAAITHKPEAERQEAVDPGAVAAAEEERGNGAS